MAGSLSQQEPDMLPEIPVDLRMRLLYPTAMDLLIPDIGSCTLTEVFPVEIWQDLPEQVDIILTRVTEVMEHIGDPEKQQLLPVFLEQTKICSLIWW